MRDVVIQSSDNSFQEQQTKKKKKAASETYAAVLSKDRELTEQVAKYNVCIVYLVIGNHSVVYTCIPRFKVHTRGYQYGDQIW